MIKLLFLPGLMAFSLTACQSADKPAAFTAAEEAFDKADDADLNNSMPRAMELADIRFSEAEDLLDESDDALEDGDSVKADELRNQAIAKANESIAILNAGMSLKDQVTAFDDNLVVQDTEKLATENRNLREQIAQLREQTGTGDALAEFEIAKPVAFFETNSAEITGDFSPEIQQMAQTLKSHPELYLTLEGFADPRGSTEHNQKLSEQRAQSVMDELVAQGIAAERIRMAGRGETGETTTSAAELQLDRKVVAKFSTVAH